MFIDYGDVYVVFFFIVVVCGDEVLEVVCEVF